MKKFLEMKFTSFAICSLTWGLSQFSFAAEEPKYEIFVNNGAGINFSFASTNTTSYAAFFSQVNTGNFTGGYFLTNNLELILTPGFFLNSASTTNTLWAAQVGLAYNFSDVIADSMFIEAQIGYGGNITTTAVSSNSTSGLVWSAALGKRFKLVDHISYTPMVSYTNSAFGGAGTTTGVLSLIPLQFSLLF